jgi:hypothetical protein
MLAKNPFFFERNRARGAIAAGWGHCAPPWLKGLQRQPESPFSPAKKCLKIPGRE